MASKQPIKGGHCCVKLDGLWTVLFSTAHPPHFLENILHILHILYISAQCQVFREQVKTTKIFLQCTFLGGVQY